MRSCCGPAPPTETSDTPPFSPTVTPGPSPASPTCECTATWSCRRRRVNHVAKRLNTALRKLASSGKKAGVTFGGHGFGKLTGKKIETLSRYYPMAVQAHPHDVSGLHNAILVSFDHCSSTDENSEHDRVGARSWCFYQKAPATGQEPGPHRTNVGTPLAPDVAKHVKEVYTRLTSSSGAHWAKRRMRTKASILLCGANAPRRHSLALSALSPPPAVLCHSSTLASRLR